MKPDNDWPRPKCNDCKHTGNRFDKERCLCCTHLHVEKNDNFEPAEPEVLTANDLVLKRLCDISEKTSGERAHRDGFYNFSNLVDIAELAIKNGRLERDLQWRNALKERWDGVAVINKLFFDEWLENNLPPLNPEDENIKRQAERM